MCVCVCEEGKVCANLCLLFLWECVHKAAVNHSLQLVLTATAKPKGFHLWGCVNTNGQVCLHFFSEIQNFFWTGWSVRSAKTIWGYVAETIVMRKTVLPQWHAVWQWILLYECMYLLDFLFCSGCVGSIKIFFNKCSTFIKKYLYELYS